MGREARAPNHSKDGRVAVLDGAARDGVVRGAVAAAVGRRMACRAAPVCPLGSFSFSSSLSSSLSSSFPCFTGGIGDLDIGIGRAIELGCTFGGSITRPRYVDDVPRERGSARTAATHADRHAGAEGPGGATRAQCA